MSYTQEIYTNLLALEQTGDQCFNTFWCFVALAEQCVSYGSLCLSSVCLSCLAFAGITCVLFTVIFQINIIVCLVNEDNFNNFMKWNFRYNYSLQDIGEIREIIGRFCIFCLESKVHIIPA